MGLETLTVWRQMQCGCNVDLEPECILHCHPIIGQSGSPTVSMAVPGMASRLASGSPLFANTVGTFTCALQQPVQGNEP